MRSLTAQSEASLVRGIAHLQTTLITTQTVYSLHYLRLPLPTLMVYVQPHLTVCCVSLCDRRVVKVSYALYNVINGVGNESLARPVRHQAKAQFSTRT